MTFSLVLDHEELSHIPISFLLLSIGFGKGDHFETFFISTFFTVVI